MQSSPVIGRKRKALRRADGRTGQARSPSNHHHKQSRVSRASSIPRNHAHPAFYLHTLDVCCPSLPLAAGRISWRTSDATATQLCAGKRHWSGFIPHLPLDNMAAVQASQGNMQQTGSNAASSAAIQGVLPPGVSKEQLQAMYKVGHHS